MKIRKVMLFVAIAQIVLLFIEIVMHFDTSVRQFALALTNIAVTGALVLVERWLNKKGSQLSWITILFAASAVWLDALGNFQHMYAGFWWWDRVTHTVGGMALSAGFIDLFLSYRKAGKLHAGWTWAAWMGVLVGQLVGSVYEISEWLGDYWFHTERVRGQYDSAHDLFQNLVGGLFVLLLFWLINRRQRFNA